MVNYLTTKIPNENLASDSITTIQNNNSGIKISFNLKRKILHYTCNHNICRLKIEKIKANVLSWRPIILFIYVIGQKIKFAPNKSQYD